MGELASLTGLRGLAALAVVGFHYRIPGFGHGDYAVDLFFVLSGYVLAHVYRDDFSLGSFFLSRFARTLPTHLVALIIFSLGALAVGHHNWRAVALNLVLVVPENPPTWSLTIEWIAYLAFPLIVRRHPPPVLLFILGISLGLAGMLSKDNNLSLNLPNLVRGLGWFTAGLALYRLGWRPPRTWLDARPVRWLGDISYPLYLIHYMPFVVLTDFDVLPITVAGQVIGIAASFGLALLLHHIVEAPARRALREVPGRWQQYRSARRGAVAPPSAGELLDTPGAPR